MPMRVIAFTAALGAFLAPSAQATFAPVVRAVGIPVLDAVPAAGLDGFEAPSVTISGPRDLSRLSRARRSVLVSGFATAPAGLAEFCLSSGRESGIPAVCDGARRVVQGRFESVPVIGLVPGWNTVTAWLRDRTGVIASAHVFLEVGRRDVGEVTASKSLVAPRLDGRCQDERYGAGGIASLAGGGDRAVALVLHSGLDLFVCLQGLPATGRRVAVRVGAGRSSLYELGVTREGRMSVSRWSGASRGGPVRFPAGTFTAKTSRGRGGWTAELRIGLDVVGGYARTDLLNLALERGRVIVASWPEQSRAREPGTWGRLRLAPVPPRSLQAGSAFVGGLGGHLSLPSAPDLAPREATLSAWVRVVGGQCGPLFGERLLRRLWRDACEVVNASRTLEPDTENLPRIDRWHHVAVTTWRDGRSVYLDGVLARRAGGEDDPEALGIADLGGDPSVRSNGILHGYVQDLTLWGRRLRAPELRRVALRGPRLRARGLIAYWPFAHGLRDVVGGHDLGLVGDASLARATRGSAALGPQPSSPEHARVRRAPIGPWDAKIPFAPTQVNFDGICSLPEYGGTANLILEPDRVLSMQIGVDDRFLNVCINPLPGGRLADRSVTLFVYRDTDGRLRGVAPIRVRLDRSGRLGLVGADGRSVVGPAPTGSRARVISAPVLDVQHDDLSPVRIPWWAAEMRIALDTLAPIGPGEALRFAIVATSKLGVSVRGRRAQATLRESWPRTFDAERPRTWGRVETVASGQVPTQTPAVHEQAATIIRLLDVGPQARAAPATSWPRAQPTVPDFKTACPTLKTKLTAKLFGLIPISIGLPDDLPYAYNRDLKWPIVDPAFRVVQAEGRLTSLEISHEDSPYLHTSHDLDMKLDVAEADGWKVLNSGEDRSLVLETESGRIDHEFRPLPADHVTVQGRWIFDCGHAAKTEIHPLPVLESDRLETRPLGYGPGLRDVRVVRVWMNSEPGAFSYNLGAFRFSADFPTTGSSPDSLPGREAFVRVVRKPEGGTVSWSATAATAAITVTPPKPKGIYTFELMLGYLDSTVTKPAGGDTYTVQLDRIDIHNDHLAERKGLDAGVTTLHGDGHWFMDSIFNDTWWPLLRDADVHSGKSYSFSGPAAFVPVAAGAIVLGITGYVNDDPAQGPPLGRGGYLGDAAALCCNTERIFASPEKDWTLHFRVLRGSTLEPRLDDPAFWKPRVEDEDRPKSAESEALGTIPVGSSFETEWPVRGTLAERPLSHGETTLLAPDVDKMHFTLEDFADVSFLGLPTGTTLTQFPFYDYPGYEEMPPEVQAFVGWRRNYLTLKSASGAAADIPYVFRIKARYRTLPPDPGAGPDGPTQFRPVDLTAGSHSRTLPWAWQRVEGEVHRYDVTIPKAAPPPPGHLPCEGFDTPGGLDLFAGPMRLDVLGDPKSDEPLGDSDLNARFPSGHVRVAVTRGSLVPARRGVYRFEATWHDSKYYDEKACTLVKKLRREATRTYVPVSDFTGLPLDPESIYKIVSGPFGPGGLPPGPLLERIPVYTLGGFRALSVQADTPVAVDILSADDQPIGARLYDMHGVLLGEFAVPAASNEGGGYGELTRVAHVRVDSVNANAAYVLQFVPAFAVGASEPATPLIGLTNLSRAP